MAQIDGVMIYILVKDQADNAVKTQKAWGGSQHRIGHALPNWVLALCVRVFCAAVIQQTP